MTFLGERLRPLGWAGMAVSFSGALLGFLYLIPVAAYLIAWVWLGDVPTLLSVVGVCVTLAGILIVNTFGGRIPKDGR